MWDGARWQPEQTYRAFDLARESCRADAKEFGNGKPKSSVLAAKVAPVFDALTAHGITATALHSHLIGEEPKLYYMHFWADGPLTEVLQGLRAALDAAR